MKKELVLVLDFGGQYNQLIARRVRELSVYSEMVPFNISYEEVLAKQPRGIILSGGQKAFMLRMHPPVTPGSLKWVFQYWEYATECSYWLSILEDR